MPVKLIIFDLDGTLVDSSRDIADAVNYALEPYAVPRIPVQETIALVGEGVSRLIEKVMQKEGLGVGKKDVVLARFLEYYTAHLVDKTTVYPGVRETLERLRGYRKAVISNKLQSLSVKVLADLGLASYLDIIVGSDTTSERKPSPVPVRHVLDTLGVGPGDAVIVGDSNYDIEAGKAAGIRTVAVTYGYRPLDKLTGADFIINRMNDLVDIVEKLT